MTKEEFRWEKYPNKEERRFEALSLLKSLRGQYIISQALTKAIEVMQKEKHPEYSNIEDMQLLKTELFPLYPKISNKEKEILKTLVSSQGDEK